MPYKFSKRSQSNLNSCNEQLIKLCHDVIQFIDFTIIEGYRSKHKQYVLYANKKTQLDGINHISNHNYLPSLAVDVIPYEKNHNPFDGSEKSELMFYRLYRQFFISSQKLNIPINWGGFWSFKDYPHIELRS